MFTPTMEHAQLKRIVEAALLAAGHPLTLVQLNELFDEDQMPGVDAIANALADLQADCDGRGIELVEVASGWRYQIRTDKASGITNDPNTYSDNPRYIIDLLKRIVTVSLETMRIVDSLPGLSPSDGSC